MTPVTYGIFDAVSIPPPRSRITRRRDQSTQKRTCGVAPVSAVVSRTRCHERYPLVIMMARVVERKTNRGQPDRFWDFQRSCRAVVGRSFAHELHGGRGVRPCDARPDWEPRARLATGLRKDEPSMPWRSRLPGAVARCRQSAVATCRPVSAAAADVPGGGVFQAPPSPIGGSARA